MKDFFNEYHELLYNCNKPYQYVGGEFLSRNKSFNDAKVTFAFAFPDKYEIGISNLGQRVLYGIINDHPEFMADRIYAPDVDFKENLIKSGKEFYSLETKTPLKSFDLIGFSLQYELSYPTVLAMMEMAKIPHLSTKRGGNDPIILAGGPCAYNPLPLAKFVDAFLIGDGEEVVLEVCEAIKLAKENGLSREEKIKKLSEIEGVFVPKLFSKKTPHPNPLPQGAREFSNVKKRIVQIDYDNALKSYPIPFSSSIHDRAIVEIRRGCGRMCRFCQPGHVNLPVRERSAEDIIKIAKELVHNTGYDEYSLLSLSSNDYSNIKEVIKELAVDFDEKKVSVSLPSQRIDGFNLELANLVQSVRKSTMTLAPEAGSQRLRDVIRKNISEEQIIDAALTLYENGWSKIKFYFIVGLPTETMDDVEEMANLLEKIKFQTKNLKREKGLKHSLDMVCTLSIFVPKPFTPFQWAPQANLEDVHQRIHYLKEKTKHIKGLKINYHEKFVSQIEAVLTRGDEGVCDFVEKLWEKGCYLDAWSEYFDRNVWVEAAEEAGISLRDLAQKEYGIEENLPWDFIDVGVDKNWLIQEYQDALKNQTKPSCETGCVSCGVCKNFKTHKVMDKPYVGKQETGNREQRVENPKENHLAIQPSNPRYRIKLTKKGLLRYFSHLDWQNTFMKALARTGLNIAFSQGFNPSMKVSLGVALPLFLESECEFADIEIIEEPPIKLTGKELGEFGNEADLRTAAIDYYKKNIQGKTVEHPELGTIEFTKIGLKKTFFTSADIRKIQLVPKLQEVIAAAQFEGEKSSYKSDGKFDKYYYLINSSIINGEIFQYRITVGQDNRGKKYYNINDIKYSPPTLTELQNPCVDELKKDLLTVTGKQIPGINKSTTIITDVEQNFNPLEDAEIKSIKLKLEKVLPEGCDIIEIVKIDKSVKSVDTTVQWAEYQITVFEESVFKIEDLRYNMDKVLSSEEIFMTKKNKKGILKNTNIKPSIKSYRFEDDKLFVILKVGSGEVPALRADNLVNLIAPDVIFDIKRTRFFDEDFQEK